LTRRGNDEREANVTSSTSGASTTPTGTASATNNGVTSSADGTGAVTVSSYASDPVSSPTFDAGSFFDVQASRQNTFSSFIINDCSIGSGDGFEWYNPAANSGGGAWSPVVGDPGPTYTAAFGSTPACVSVTLNNTSTSPTINQLTGTVFAVLIAAPTTLKVSPAVLKISGLTLYLFNLSATLNDATGPIAGQTIRFTVGSTFICSAVTAPNGTASCSGTAKILSIVLRLGYTASYGGNSAFRPSTATAGLVS
jgi:hypothetical protein